MRWDDINAELRSLKSSGRDAEIQGVDYDSRRVGPGDVFVAMRGGSTDGNRFVDAALQQGAAAIVTDSSEVFDQLQRDQPGPASRSRRARPPRTRRGERCSLRPSRAQTQTQRSHRNQRQDDNDLSPRATARSVGRKSVLLGTIETHIAGEVRATDHTTPESRDIYSDLRRRREGWLHRSRDGDELACARAGTRLGPSRRCRDLHQSHAGPPRLPRHDGTRTRRAKAKLFAGVGAPLPRVAVINEDDPWTQRGCKANSMGEN